MPKSNNTTIWTTIYLVVCGYGCKNGHQKDMFSKEIGVRAQNTQNHWRLDGQHETYTTT